MPSSKLDRAATPAIQSTTATAATPSARSQPAEARGPAVIATRGRCEADGVGLSHYILMDRKDAA